MIVLVIVTVPDRFWKISPSSNDSLPLPVTDEFSSENPDTPLPLMPCWPLPVTLRLSSETLLTFCKYRFATQLRLLPTRRSPPHVAALPRTVCTVPLPVRFIFLSVTVGPSWNR